MPNPNYPDFPSVTQVLSPFSGLDRVPPDVLEAACDRGINVHEACLSWALSVAAFKDLYRGDFVLAPSPVKGYLSSFRRWWEEVVVELVAVEPPMCHPVYQYTGKPDLIVGLRGDTAASVVDLKTSKARGRTWCAQLAAYRELSVANFFNVARVMSVRLRSDGGPAIVDEYDYSDKDFAAFLSALTAYRYFGGGGR